MSLTSVKMSEEVWLTCLTHALSTETEEIMGLLLGDIQHSNNGDVTALIWGALPQPRSDRQKDRVETNPEQLTAASVLAERMTIATGTTSRVIGWYHSHPHMTVLPSHVDVKTQAMYQLMDSGFIGLIFSCFSEDAQKVGRIQIIAFQSWDRKQQHMMKVVPLSPRPKIPVVNVESSLSSSDYSTGAPGTSRGEIMNQDTGDSASKEVGKLPRLGGFFAGVDTKAGNAIQDLDPMDVSDGVQEAIHLSNLEMSGAEFVRNEIPLHVVPASSLIKLDSPLASYKNLQRMLYEEEKTAYNQAMAKSTRNGKVNPLSFIHHTSTYKASMCKMIEFCLSPAMTVLEDRLRENEIKLKLLEEEANLLNLELTKPAPTNSSPRSPSQVYRNSSQFGGSRSKRGLS